jgi:hypothetical protein
VVPEAITFLLVLGYWGYMTVSKEKLSRKLEAMLRLISPVEQNWWEKIRPSFHRNESKTNEGVPVTDTEFSESPSAIVSDARVVPKRPGSLRSHGKKESYVEVSGMA